VSRKPLRASRGHAPLKNICAVGAGPGNALWMKVYSGLGNPLTGQGTLLASFLAYSPSLRDGVRVAIGDVNGDGKADIITGAGAGGGPHVKAFDFWTLNAVASFFAYPATFTGGVNVAVASPNTLTAPGGGIAPTVNVFDRTGAQLLSFNAFDPTFQGGVFVG
jgi:hypothetical protein